MKNYGVTVAEYIKNDIANEPTRIGYKHIRLITQLKQVEDEDTTISECRIIIDLLNKRVVKVQYTMGAWIEALKDYTDRLYIRKIADQEYSG